MCDICYERVLANGGAEARFGLLENCAHAFCLGCIRAWRARAQASIEYPEAQRVEAARACPICRTESHFVIPCDRLVVVAERKAALIADFKSSTAAIPCRHFNFGRGMCPFGSSCFYLHQLPDGSAPSLPAPRFIADENGESRAIGRIVLSDFLEKL